MKKNQYSSELVLANTDWVNSTPVFYNEKTKKHSDKIYDVIDWQQFEWDWDGLALYLLAGYCTLTRTPVKGVRFMPSNSTLLFNNNSVLIRTQPYVDYDQNAYDTTNVENLNYTIRNYINNGVSIDTPVVCPFSSGYDSRHLLSLIKERKNLYAFTYGVSEDQYKSIEVVYAKLMADANKIPWRHIELGDFLRYEEDILSLTEFSSHMHGMYHYDFYTQILKHVSNGTVLSGAVGDAWAGSLEFPKLKDYLGYQSLFLHHNIMVDPQVLVSRWSLEPLIEYFERNKERLSSPKNRIVEAITNKMMMLRYLYKVPYKLGFSVIAPYLDHEIAKMMLNISDSERKDRKWQRTYFQKSDHWQTPSLHLPPESFINSIDMQAYKKRPLTLDPCLSEIIDSKYIKLINAGKDYLPFYNPYTDDLRSNGPFNSIYNAIRVLKPLEYLIKTRAKMLE